MWTQNASQNDFKYNIKDEAFNSCGNYLIKNNQPIDELENNGVVDIYNSMQNKPNFYDLNKKSNLQNLNESMAFTNSDELNLNYNQNTSNWFQISNSFAENTNNFYNPTLLSISLNKNCPNNNLDSDSDLIFESYNSDTHSNSNQLVNYSTSGKTELSQIILNNEIYLMSENNYYIYNNLSNNQVSEANNINRNNNFNSNFCSNLTQNFNHVPNQDTISVELNSSHNKKFSNLNRNTNQLTIENNSSHKNTFDNESNLLNQSKSQKNDYSSKIFF